MKINSFTISECIFMLDLIKEDKERWSKMWHDPDVIAEYSSIISKLETRINEYQSFNRAFRQLEKF